MEEVTNKELEDEKMVSEAYQHLVETYLKSKHRKHVEIIDKAYNFAKEAHKGVRRLSGEPYIMHPIAVAQIACEEIGLGSTSICAALLHDVVEDTDYTAEDIANIFGEKIAQIVDGLTKISGGIFGDKASAQAESFKKLLLTMSDDIRVILIKISDRLHNMRTLGSQLPNKQYKIAGETLYIYAPLANRLGLNKIKEELEDLSFSYEHPEEYRALKAKLAGMKEHLTSIFDQFTAPLREKFDEAKIKYEIKARIKTPYSIWSKMQNKHVTFEEIYDILAVRIIFDCDDINKEIAECFQIYAIASSIYKPHPERMRDWLAHPKANGYQALHTTLMSKTGRWVEVQIRSRRMDDKAEQGFAAHWKYKEGSKTTEDSENELDNWLLTIKEILDDPQPNAIDFLDTIKLNLYASEIFVVTPKGEFKTMPANCTVLDFAFNIHTFLGTHCIGAKVNHHLVPISHVLQSGDQVEILTSKSQKVEREWMQFATTAKAKGKIQAILRREDREKQKEGEELLNAFFQKIEKEPNSINIDKLCRLHNMQSREELLVAVGEKRINLGDNDEATILNKIRSKKGWGRYLTLFKRHNDKAKANANADTPVNVAPIKIDKKKPLVLNEETMAHYIICQTCHPIPGDDVLGYFDGVSSITIHKRQCEVASRLKASDGNHILAAKWDTHKQLSFLTTIYLEGIDHIGVLHQITGVLSQQLNVNIHKLNIDSKDGIFTAEIQLGVHDVTDILSICKKLKKIKEIKDVRRK
ncbi:MAG: bifunctional (p)ppGpp synthetase/guanosine-3',5'-bis(diphosphate) 3'-pyrophosphohydrolase [Bacteroidaceae bacterium]|nr:bifunctional (p)ppGpp synthetase/guanosine-3',5'-bis(diphosphate) 3'-pyrophosphohydrolase [Bacteroidaceae bacterium]